MAIAKVELIGKGEFGIPVKVFTNDFPKNSPITTGSGRTVLASCSPHKVSVRSPDSDAVFVAKLKESGKDCVLLLQICSLVNDYSYKYGKHPDFFAAELVSEFLKSRALIGLIPTALSAFWMSPDSVNGDEFFKTLDKLMQHRQKPTAAILREAAICTWTGRQAIKHGFTRIPANGISIEETYISKNVTVMFTRGKK